MTGPRSVGSASVTIVPDTSGWVAKISAQILPSAKTLGEQFGKVMGDEIARQLGERTKNAPIGPDEPKSRDQGSKSAGAFADAFKAKLRAAMAALPPIEIGVAASEAEQKLRDIRVDLADLSGKQIGVDLTDIEAIAKLDELRARLAELNASAESVSIRADTSVALAQLDKLRASIDEMTAVKHDVDVDVNVDDRQLDEVPAKLAAVDAAAGNSSGGINLFGSRIANIGALAIGAADVAIPALLAIGAAAGGLIAAVGVGALGFSGIGEALQAKGSPFASGGGGGGSGASTAIQAQQRQLAAAQATQSAQDQLTSAVQNQTKAEKNLHDARVQALQDLQDLDNKLKDNTLSQQQAAIDLVQAKQTLAVTLTAPGATLAQYAQQVAQAQLNVATAQQKVNELALTGSRLTPQDALAHKQGVNGNPAVVSAQQALTDANHKLAEAQQNVTAVSVKNKLADDAAAASLANAAGGANSYAAALAKLNPLQKQFVEFLISLKPLLDDLKDAASKFLPGLEAGLKAAEPAFAVILTVVGNVATALGTAFQQIFAQFNTPAGKQFATFLATELPKQIGFITKLFIDFGIIFAQIWEAAGPLITAVDTAITDFFNSLAAATGKNGLKDFFDSLIPLVKPTEALLQSFGSLIGKVFIALAPALAPFLTVVAQVATQLAKIAVPILKPLASAFAALLTALVPLLPLFAQMVQQLLPPLINFFEQLVEQGVIPLVDALIKQLAPQMPGIIKSFIDLLNALIPLIGPITSILVALTPLLPLFVELTVGPLKQITPLIREATPFIAEMAKVLNTVLGPAIRATNTVFGAMNTVVGTVFGTIGRVISTSLNAVITVFHNIAGPLKTAFSAIWSGIESVWTGVSKFFKGLANGIVDIINGLINLLDKIHIHIPKLHIPGTSVDFGGGDIGFNIPDIPHLAAGGIVQPTPGGTLARLGEAGVAEAVIPLPQLPDLINKLAGTGHFSRGVGQRPVTQNIYTNDPLAAAHAVVTRMAARAV